MVILAIMAVIVIITVPHAPAFAPLENTFYLFGLGLNDPLNIAPSISNSPIPNSRTSKPAIQVINNFCVLCGFSASLR